MYDGVLPCPHCSSHAFVAHYTTYYKVRCQNGSCGACGGSAPTPEEAKRLWNKRPSRLNAAPFSIKDAARSLGMTDAEYGELVNELFEEEIFGK